MNAMPLYDHQMLMTIPRRGIKIGAARCRLQLHLMAFLANRWANARMPSMKPSTKKTKMLHFKNLNHSVDQGRYPQRQVFSALVDRDFLVSVMNANVLSVNAEQDNHRASSMRFLLPADKILSPKLLGTNRGLI